MYNIDIIIMYSRIFMHAYYHYIHFIHITFIKRFKHKQTCYNAFFKTYMRPGATKGTLRRENENRFWMYYA